MRAFLNILFVKYRWKKSNFSTTRETLFFGVYWALCMWQNLFPRHILRECREMLIFPHLCYVPKRTSRSEPESMMFYFWFVWCIWSLLTTLKNWCLWLSIDMWMHYVNRNFMEAMWANKISLQAWPTAASKLMILQLNFIFWWFQVLTHTEYSKRCFWKSYSKEATNHMFVCDTVNYILRRLCR